MAAITNPWQDVFLRSYTQIKNGLIQRMRTKLPEVTDYSEGNIFIILISMWAAIAEVIHYYIDNMGRETFFTTARRYSSLIKHAKLVDYHVKAAIPASADILLQLEDGAISKKTYIIPINTMFLGENGLTYISVKQKTFYEGTFGVTIPVEQKTAITNKSLGNIIDPNSIIYIDETDGFYAEGSATLRVNNELWTLVETFAYSGPNDKHYTVLLTDDQKPYIKFGDGSYGMKPPTNAPVVISYYVTQGISGNTAENTIQTLSSTIEDIVKPIINNPNPASGGSNYEDFNQLKVHVPLSIRTLGVAITKQDYEDIAKLAPGVDKAYVNFKCGKFVDIYIIPDGGGIASEALIDSTQRYISNKKIITTNIRVLPTGSSLIYLDLTITGKPAMRSNIITENVLKALIEAYNYNTSEINKVVRLSDLYALIDNVETVDYLTINKLYTIPYPVPDDDTKTPLNLQNFSISSIKDDIDFEITYKGNNIFEIKSDYGEVYNAQLNSPLKIISSDGTASFQFTIGNPLTGAYSVNDLWTIHLIPNGKDQVIQDFSVPRILESNVAIDVIETA